MTVRYISDTHWGHKNVIAYDNRPFSSVEEMDNVMVWMWNATVKADDFVYILGDVCWSQTYEDWESLFNRLKGQKFVIKGNHDRSEILKKMVKQKLIIGWSHQEIINDNNTKVVLNHSPMPFFINERHDDWVHLYGHVHDSFDWNMTLNVQRQLCDLYGQNIRMYNVGCMMPYIQYVPRTLEEIETGFAKVDFLKLDFKKKLGLEEH